MHWLTIVSILVVLVGVWWLMRSGVTRTLWNTLLSRQSTDKIRIWTPGKLSGVNGRYYMAAAGVTRATAQQLILDNLRPGLQPEPEQLEQAAATLSAGTILFYFRANGDLRPLAGSEAVYLAPVGDISEVTSTDMFKIQNDKTLTIPRMQQDPVMVCTQGQVCTPGLLGFGQAVVGEKLEIEQGNGEGVRLKQGFQYLTLGPHLCPTDNGALASRCARLIDGVGGPRVARLSSSDGDVFYIERL